MKVLYKIHHHIPRKLLRRVHDGILYAITTIAFIGCFGAICTMASMTAQGYTIKDFIIAAAILLLSMVWFTIFFAANCEGR